LLPRLRGLGERRGDDDTLAGGEAVRLDHDRRPPVTNVLQRLAEFREAAICRGRNAVTLEKRFAERLRPFQLRGLGGRAEAGKAALAEAVHDARHEGHLGTYDGQADGFGFRHGQQLVDVIGRDRDVARARLQRRTGVARRDQDLGHFG
jgi:hypothetical protein